jgi:hypothetical protein
MKLFAAAILLRKQSKLKVLYKGMPVSIDAGIFPKNQNHENKKQK